MRNLTHESYYSCDDDDDDDHDHDDNDHDNDIICL